jgi:glycosyltransferase involved in cell wall biosynthesis
LAARTVCRVSVVIPTYNRAALLAQTLERLAFLAPATVRTWEVVVVDNNCSDETPAVVKRLASAFPVRLRHVFEGRQGRSHALNTGILAAAADVLAFIDDDVVVSDRWLDEAAAPLLAGTSGIDYTGGPVQPLWEAPRPAWLADDKGDLWGTIAILNYGPEPFVFEDRRRVPLGANMAVRRDLVDRIGGFSPRLGRAGSNLMGQEVPEFLARARAAGARGLYVPAMVVDHHVPAGRLTKRYFRRWWFGKGMARAEMDRLQPIDECGIDHANVRHVRGVPLFMFHDALATACGWIGSAIRVDRQEQFRHEMMLCYYAGYASARQREARSLSPAWQG